MTALALPEPPASAAAPAARRPLLAQCLVLAGLLHLLLVLVFGNTPGGSAKPGEGLWGAFQVRLVGSGPAGQPEAAVIETPHTGAPGQADRQRFGGAVRPDVAPRPSDGPGAARAGRWLPLAAGGDAEASPLATSADPAGPAVLPLAAADLPARPSIDLARPLPAEPATALPSAVPAERQLAGPAAAPPLPARHWPAPAPVARLTAEPAPAAPLQPPPVPSFEVQSLPAPRAVAPRPPGRPLAPPAAVDLPAVAPPALPSFAAEAPLPARAAAPRPAERSLAPLTSTELPPTPTPLPDLPSFPVQAAPPPRTLAQRERPSALGALAPAELAAALADAPPLPGFAAQPAAPPRAVAARAAPSAVTPPASADLGPAPAEAPALPGFAVAPPDASALAAAPVPASPLGVKQAAGAPDAGARLGHDIATAPSQPASAARLKLDLVRPRGGPIAAQGSRGLLSVVPHPPELKTKLEKEIELSGLADCRKAYSAMGLAAALPLMVDALREKGCRW